MPSNRSRTLTARRAPRRRRRRRRAATCRRSAVTAATPAQVVDHPDVGRAGGGDDREQPRTIRRRTAPRPCRRSADPVSRPRSSAGTSGDVGVHRPRRPGRPTSARRTRRRSDPRVRSSAPSARCRQCQRAAISALRLPAVPPLTNTPPAVAGSPTRSAIHRSASFSAKIAPPPSSHDPAYTLDAPTTRSNRIDASVGAAGTNDRNRGWSTEMHAGPSTSP